MAIDKKIQQAMKTGRQQADEVLKFRTQELRRRTTAVKRQMAAVRAVRVTAPVAPKLVRAAGGPGSAGVLVAEGDSWFDYPLNDILRLLEDHQRIRHRVGGPQRGPRGGHGLRTRAVRGIYAAARKASAAEHRPQSHIAVRRGQHIAGEEFGMLINHALSPVAGLNGAGKIINGPDLSIESQNTAFRYLDTNGHGTFMAGLVAGKDAGLTTRAPRSPTRVRFERTTPIPRPTCGPCPSASVG